MSVYFIQQLTLLIKVELEVVTKLPVHKTSQEYFMILKLVVVTKLLVNKTSQEYFMISRLWMFHVNKSILSCFVFLL
jgi:hypothetical protein